MFKKFVAKALLPLVMEKSARDKLGKIQTAKKNAGQVEQAKLPQQQKATPKNKSTFEILEESAATLDEPDQLLDCLKRLEQALDDGALTLSTPQKLEPKSGGRNISPERQALIQQALATQSEKEKLLDNLDPEDRLRLHLMAKKIMMPEKS